MSVDDSTVSKEAAESVVQFLREAEGEYVVKFPHRIGGLPFLRPAGYGGFKAKSLTGPAGNVEEDHYSDEEVAGMIATEPVFEVVHRASTPPEIWGTPREDANAHVTADLLEAERTARRAAENIEDGDYGAIVRNAADIIDGLTNHYIAEGAEGDAEVSGDGE